MMQHVSRLFALWMLLVRAFTLFVSQKELFSLSDGGRAAGAVAGYELDTLL